MHTAETVKKKKPLLAGLLSIIAPGLWHVYAGSLINGLLLVAVPNLVLVITGLLLLLLLLLLDISVPKYFYGLILCTVEWYLYSIVSSFMFARKNQEYK